MTLTQLETVDVDEARTRVADAFCAHRLVPRDRAGIHCRFRLDRLGVTSVGALDYGREVSIEPGILGDFFLIQMPHSGRALVRQGDQEIVSSSRMASILSPGERVSMRWGDHNPQSFFQVGREPLEDELTHLLGHRPTSPLRFDLGFDLLGDVGRAWLAALSSLGPVVRLAEQTRDRRLLAPWERSLLTQLLLSVPHTYSEQLHRGEPATHGVIRRAADLIADHYAEQLTMADIAEAVGVSARSLQEGFQRQLGTTPMTFLREKRLAAARVALESPDDQRSVTMVALSCGFNHLGRFSIAYRERFGHSPSSARASA